MNTICAISALKDNYIWAVHSPARSEVVLIDPGDALPALTFIEANKVNLVAILITHHHADHTGGIPLLHKTYPHVPIYGPALEGIPLVTHPIQEGDLIQLAGFPEFSVLNVPGHTLGHIAYLHEHHLFCGDTLFSCGCGRLFEGTPSQLFHSLEKIKQLPLNTLIYGAHEYTLANMRFAELVDPHNNMLREKQLFVQHQRNQQQPSLPVLLAEELKINPFLRCYHKDIQAAVEKTSTQQTTCALDVFTLLRAWKDQF